jgi:L-lactate dehydrogenase complex protein LldG
MMMSSRDTILARISANRPAGRHDLPTVPDFTSPSPEGVQARFIESLKVMGGGIMERHASGDLLQPLRTRLAGSSAVCSAVPEVSGNIPLTTEMDPRELADVDVAVVRAAFAIAETGSVLFTEEELQINSLAYLAQHLVVLLDPADIIESTQHAYMQPQFHKAHYACFHSGPSATADIEGVLIHGAQGVRSLTVTLIARASPNVAAPDVARTGLPPAGPGQSSTVLKHDNSRGR